MSATSFLALYRGRTVGEARLVAVTADPEVVAEFAARLLQKSPPDDGDPVAGTVEDARQQALRLVVKEVGHV